MWLDKDTFQRQGNTDHRRRLSKPLHKHRSAHLQTEIFVFLQELGVSLQWSTRRCISANTASFPCYCNKTKQIFSLYLKKETSLTPPTTLVFCYRVWKNRQPQYMYKVPSLLTFTDFREEKMSVSIYCFFTPEKRMKIIFCTQCLHLGPKWKEVSK